MWITAGRQGKYLDEWDTDFSNLQRSQKLIQETREFENQGKNYGLTWEGRQFLA